MKRIDTIDRAIDLFAPGKDGLKEQVPGVSQATQLTAKWFNGVQEAVVRTIEAAGIALSEADFDQFTTAIQWIANQAALNRVTQSGGIGQIAGLVKIGKAAGAKLKAEVDGVDQGNFAFEPWVVSQITGQIAALVNSSPAALDTLNELAAALGNDANFAATMTNALATKETRFPVGTQMLFAQSVAPVGWTKVVTHNDKLLRVVSGAAASGGTVAFSAAFVNGSVGATSLTIAQLPAHTHQSAGTNGVGQGAAGTNSVMQQTGTQATSSVGNGDTHTHTINLDVAYVDIIIASRN
ncbi:MAG: hypothetical protein Q7R66_18570 [Undibacterium sp.]|uniref:hypothetical protein n=1 Tax=Undibacterium sp. TaxID=1914977 RepID=UPI00272799D8|nr:hypothetical protein [Undibacterium sp.]MDO8654180.1 hypothetical protein [Undibacterium sp.]